MTRVLVLAQGDGHRWDTADGPYLGAPKHLVEVDGETLIARTVRQFAAAGCEVVVVARDDPRYRLPGASLATLEDPTPTGTNQDKLLATRPLWAPEGRTVVVFGDVWHSDECAASIAGHDGEELHYWRRPTPSKVTGHRWDETFAVSFGPTEHERVARLAEGVVELHRLGVVARPFLRCHYALSLGLEGRRLSDLAAIRSTPDQTVIDDWTDDFDSPVEWRGWMGRRHAGAHRVAVCVPWVEGDDWRRWSRAWCHRHWESLGLEVFYGGVPAGGPVNRSASRNASVTAALAARPDLEVVFLADADTYVAGDQLWAAAHWAATRGQLTRAFDDYRKASQQATRAMRRLRRPAAGPKRADRSAENHASGALAVPVGLWREVGGQDERFPSWGGEDRAFFLAASTLAGWAPKVNGVAWHLWHPSSPERRTTYEHYQANIDLGMRYKALAGVLGHAGILPASKTPVGPADPDGMRALLAEPGAPLHPGTVTVGVPVAPAPYVAPAAPARRERGLTPAAKARIAARREAVRGR